jgi:hypothetical protein
LSNQNAEENFKLENNSQDEDHEGEQEQQPEEEDDDEEEETVEDSKYKYDCTGGHYPFK